MRVKDLTPPAIIILIMIFFAWLVHQAPGAVAFTPYALGGIVMAFSAWMWRRFR